MYVLLGSKGNITSKVAAILRARGEQVRVVGRSAEFAGDIADPQFLAGAFAGARAVYAMIPADYAAPDLPARHDQLGEAIVRGIAAGGVKRVVNLSSIGAHLPSGTGPIAGLHRQEERLNALAGVDVLHLRPGFFFENHLHAIGTIQALGVYADMTAADAPLPMIATADIAEVVARELVAFHTTGKRTLHLHAPRHYSMRESAAVLGAAIGRPGLAYEQGDAKAVKAALVQHGFSQSAADQLEEMSAAFSARRLDGEYEKGPTEVTPTTLERFAKSVFKEAVFRIVRGTRENERAKSGHAESGSLQIPA